MMDLRERPIRVLHVLGSLDPGGVETWLMQVLDHIDKDAHQLDFCCLAGEEGIYAAKARALGSRVFAIKLTKNLLSFDRQFTRLLQEKQYDVVHSHVFHFSGYILRLAARNGVRSRIAHSFTAPNKRHLSLSRRLYFGLMKRWIDQFATMGLGNSRDSMVSLYGESWQNQVNRKLIYCGVDFSSFAPTVAITDVRQRFRIPTNAHVIGHLGRLTQAKNHRFILEIAEMIEKTEPDIWFLLVGSGSLQEELETIANKKELKRVIFAGAVTNVVPFLKTMDLLLFPSLWEGLPQSVIEAQAVGLPCLCSDAITTEVAELPDVVQFMSLRQPAEEWARKCLTMLKIPRIDPQAAWDKVASGPFSIENSVQQLVELYAQHST